MNDNEEIIDLLSDIRDLLIDTNYKLDVLTQAVNEVRGIGSDNTISDICTKLDFMSM